MFPHEEIQAAIADLRAEYIRDLPQLVHNLVHATRSLLQSPHDAGLLHNALFQAHRLRGTSGSFGFSALSAVAGHLDEVLFTIQQKGPSAWGARREEVQAAITDLQWLMEGIGKGE